LTGEASRRDGTRFVRLGGVHGIRREVGRAGIEAHPIRDRVGVGHAGPERPRPSSVGVQRRRAGGVVVPASIRSGQHEAQWGRSSVVPFGASDQHANVRLVATPFEAPHRADLVYRRLISLMEELEQRNADQDDGRPQRRRRGEAEDAFQGPRHEIPRPQQLGADAESAAFRASRTRGGKGRVAALSAPRFGADAAELRQFDAGDEHAEPRTAAQAAGTARRQTANAIARNAQDVSRTTQQSVNPHSNGSSDQFVISHPRSETPCIMPELRERLNEFRVRSARLAHGCRGGVLDGGSRTPVCFNQ